MLTNEERESFIRWLQQDIESTKLINQQLEKLKGMGVLIERNKQEQQAEEIVLRKLLSMQSQTVEG